ERTHRRAIEFRPSVAAVSPRLLKSIEAGCAGLLELGSFTVQVEDLPDDARVAIEPANAPDRPQIWTSESSAGDGEEITVFVDARGAGPGLYLIAINLRASGSERVTSAVVRGWLLVHHPTTPECKARYGG